MAVLHTHQWPSKAYWCCIGIKLFFLSALLWTATIKTDLLNSKKKATFVAGYSKLLYFLFDSEVFRNLCFSHNCIILRTQSANFVSATTQAYICPQPLYLDKADKQRKKRRKMYNSRVSLPGTIRAFVFKLIGFPFLSQLRSGGGKPVTSQVNEMKLFTTTVKFSELLPTILGGTVEIYTSPNILATWTTLCLIKHKKNKIICLIKQEKNKCICKAFRLVLQSRCHPSTDKTVYRPAQNTIKSTRKCTMSYYNLNKNKTVQIGSTIERAVINDPQLLTATE